MAPGADTSAGAPLHHAYLQATTASFTAIVFCQLGTAFAARTERVSLRSIGLATNRLLLAGCAFELAFAAALIYLPPLQSLFGTAALPAWVFAMLLPMPVLVWGADELFRGATRGRDQRRAARGPSAPSGAAATGDDESGAERTTPRSGADHR